MGATGDFDFNDVVLKLSYVAGEQNLYGQLCALGGTLETYLKFNQKNGEASVGDVIDVFAENGSKKELHSVLSGYDTKGDFKCLNTYNCKKRSRLLQQKRRCCYSSDVAKLMFSS